MIATWQKMAAAHRLGLTPLRHLCGARRVLRWSATHGRLSSVAHCNLAGRSTKLGGGGGGGWLVGSCTKVLSCRLFPCGALKQRVRPLAGHGPATCPVAGWEAGQNRKAAGQPFSAAAKPGQRLASTCGDCSRSTHLGSFRSFRVFPVIQPPPVWNPQTRATGEPMAMRTQRQEKHASRR